MTHSPPANPALQPGKLPAKSEQGNDGRAALVRYVTHDGTLIEKLTVERAQDFIRRGIVLPTFRRRRLYSVRQIARPTLRPFGASTFSHGKTIDTGEHNRTVCAGYQGTLLPVVARKVQA